MLKWVSPPPHPPPRLLPDGSPCWERWLPSGWCESSPPGSLADPASPSRPRSPRLGKSPVETGAPLNSRGRRAPLPTAGGTGQEPTGAHMEATAWPAATWLVTNQHGHRPGLQAHLTLASRKNVVNKEECGEDRQQIRNVLVLAPPKAQLFCIAPWSHGSLSHSQRMSRRQGIAGEVGLRSVPRRGHCANVNALALMMSCGYVGCCHCGSWMRG